MNSSKELKANIGAVATIESITSVYQGIASLRMNQVKEGVAKTKTFIDGVAQVYHHARQAYIGQIQRELSSSKDKGGKNLSFLRRNGKTAIVFLSANEHLYGSLILDIYRNFASDLSSGKAEAVIVGKFGKALFEADKARAAAKGTNRSTSFFELSDDKPSAEEIKKISDFIVQYEQVVLHYGQMRTILTQVPSRLEISGGINLEKPASKVRDYLFEPTPAAIMEFFETEIIAALFYEKVFEHQLSRFAARMVAMDQASQNADLVTIKLTKELLRAKKRLQNAKQLDRFAGLALWEEKKK